MQNITPAAFPLCEAKPIYTSYPVTEENTYADFFLPVTKTEAHTYRILLAVDADFALYVAPDAPLPVYFHAYTDLPTQKTYEALDLTDVLSPGENTVKITVFSPNRDTSTYQKYKPYLRFALMEDDVCILKSSEEILCRKNPHYRSGAVPMVSGQLGFSFDYDGTATDKEPLHAAVVVPDVSDDLRPCPIPRMDFSEILCPEIVKSGIFADAENGADLSRPALRMQNARLDDPSAKESGAYTIYALPREETAYLGLHAEAETETELLIGYGEHLIDGRCRTAIGPRNFAVRVKIPKGKSEFFFPFLRLGLRYLQIFVTCGTANITPYLKNAVYPVTEKPLYAPTGTIHETIEQVSRHTLHLCMHDHYEDCPWREQALYALDGRTEMLSAFYAFGETAMTASSLRLLADSIRDDALLELCAPARVSITIPYFSAAFVVALAEYYENTGDHETTEELLPTAYEILSGFYGRCKHHGWMLPAYRQKKYWNFYEWEKGLSGKIGKEDAPDEMTFDAPLMAMVSMAFTAYAKTLTTLGLENGDAAMLDQGDAVLHCSEELNEMLNTHFYDPNVGLYRTYLGVSLSDGSPFPKDPPHYAELTQCLAVLAGAVEQDRLPELLKRIYEKDGITPATLSSGIFRYEALLKMPEEYAQKVRLEIEARFSRMLNEGSTTFWETDKGDADFANAGSLCHGWSSFPIILYARYGSVLFPNDTKKEESQV